jgi:cell fate regulator YaaT (PSP1 superfamily)
VPWTVELDDEDPPPDTNFESNVDPNLDATSGRIAWGDDSDAPTPQIALAADLPVEAPADDPDPLTSPLDELAEGSDRATGAKVASVVGVKFSSAGKIHFCDGGDAVFQRGDEVVVEAERGVRVGVVAIESARRQSRAAGTPMRKILRRPNSNDRRTLERNEERADSVLARAREIARDYELPIKVFRAEFGLSGARCLLYFSAEEKVDEARQLARQLSQELHCRVDVRQTGVRDEAKMVGGIGSCGMELCCSTWLPSFVPVSIKNAKDQGLVLNPSKVSGQCGRLKCCLVYEQETYAALRKGLPKLGKRVVTADGEGRVVEVDVLRQRVRVNLGDGNVQVYPAPEVKPMFPSQSARSLSIELESSNPDEELP